jgi:hypothetical protein
LNLPALLHLAVAKLGRASSAVHPVHHAHVHLDWNGTFLKLPETEVNLIFLDRGCLDKDTNPNEAIAVSRITQNDQIGLLEPG